MGSGVYSVEKQSCLPRGQAGGGIHFPKGEKKKKKKTDEYRVNGRKRSRTLKEEETKIQKGGVKNTNWEEHGSGPEG